MPAPEPRNLNMQILGLSGYKVGLLVRVKSMEKDSFWHVHSNEMTPYQKIIHKKLGSKQ